MNDTNRKTAETEVERDDAIQTGPDASGEAPAAEAAVAEGQGDRIVQLEKEVEALKDQYVRAVAEAENIRRRAQREREDTAKYAISGFAKDLLAVADNLRRAIDSIPAESREGNELLNTLLVGVEATERQLASAFERAGIKKMEALGETFDPNFHQVMFEVENAGKPGGTIVQVLQDGYTIHGRLLREAMVGVAKRGADEGGNQRVDTSA